MYGTLNVSVRHVARRCALCVTHAPAMLYEKTNIKYMRHHPRAGCKPALLEATELFFWASKLTDACIYKGHLLFQVYPRPIPAFASLVNTITLHNEDRSCVPGFHNKLPVNKSAMLSHTLVATTTGSKCIRCPQVGWTNRI